MGALEIDRWEAQGNVEYCYCFTCQYARRVCPLTPSPTDRQGKLAALSLPTPGPSCSQTPRIFWDNDSRSLIVGVA